MGENDVRSLEDVIINLPSNSSTLVENKVKLNNVTLMIIKDDFNFLKEQISNPHVAIKGAFIKDQNILAQYIIINIREKGFSQYYKFCFDYNDEKCLRLLLNLIKQKYIYVILCHNNNNLIKEIVFDNGIKGFLKEYIERCLSSKCKWNKKQYMNLFKRLNDKFFDDELLWKELGSEVIHN
jgi:hypothetical protein